jgi:hypothetical protein
MPYKDKELGRVKSRERYREKHAYVIARQRRYYADPRRSLLGNAKQRAKLKGLACTITIDDIIVPERCPLLDIPIVRGADKLHCASPTIDRIRNDLGYVPGNIVVISYAANRAKGNLNSADLLKLATRLAAMEIFGAPIR